MELSEIREKIDAVDEQLLDLFLQRMDLSDEVAAYKNAHHLPILNKERERAILAKVTEKSGERERYAYHLFSTLFELARSRQAELISAPTKVAAQVRASLEAGTSVFPQTGLVACQGVEGANSQVACDRLLPRGNIVYVKTFQAVVSAVESGLCRFGVLPIENSSNGSVRAVYELLQDHNLSIVRSTRLCIRHELLALPGVKMSDITEIYSHEQAIGQCGKFLAGLNGVRVIPCDNTAVAAKMVSESGNRHAAPGHKPNGEHSRQPKLNSPRRRPRLRFLSHFYPFPTRNLPSRIIPPHKLFIKHVSLESSALLCLFEPGT